MYINQFKKKALEKFAFKSLIATQYELSSKTNEKRLDSAIQKLRKGSSFTKDLLDQ